MDLFRCCQRLMKKKLLPLVGLIVLTTSFQRCYYDKYEDFKVTGCDTSSVSYETHIKPILVSYCTTCHSGSAPSGGLLLDTYSTAKDVGMTGKLLGSVVWDGTASRMPQGASSRIDDCSLAKIRLWVKGNYNP